MRYMGGKGRLAQNIAYRINTIAFCENITEYYEPFMGGCSVGEIVTIPNRHFSDINNWVVELFKKIQTDMFEYKFVTREEWHDVKDHAKAGSDKYPQWYYAWVGICCSFRAVTFQAYGGEYIDTLSQRKVNPQLQCYNQLLKEREMLSGADFRTCSYEQIGKPYHAIIYCDSPYKGTHGYMGGELVNCSTRKTTFDFEKYDNWLAEMAKENLIIISEYSMNPDRFGLIESVQLNKGVGGGNTDDESSIENLYYVKGGWLTDKYFNHNTESESDDDFDF